MQQKALAAWKNAGELGTMEMCTGSGKSRVAVLAALEMYKIKPDCRILLLVPTQDLRDNNWEDEFKKWEAEDAWKQVEAMCYASAHKLDGEHFDLVIADELHRSLSEVYGQFYEKNDYDRLIGLSATIAPRLRSLCDGVCPVAFKYTLEQGIEDGIIVPYEITVIEHNMDAQTKNVRAGSKQKPFMTTEAKHYDYLNKRFNQTIFGSRKVANAKTAENMIKFAALQRARFLYGLPSKIEPAKKLLTQLIARGKRVIVFSESVDLLIDLGIPAIHSRQSDAENTKILEDFNKKRLNVIGSAKKLQEGMNLTNVNALLMLSYNSTEQGFIQKAGRILRWEAGKIGEMYIFKTLDTKEEKWFVSMIGTTSANIHYRTSRDILRQSQSS